MKFLNDVNLSHNFPSHLQRLDKEYKALQHEANKSPVFMSLCGNKINISKTVLDRVDGEMLKIIKEAGPFEDLTSGDALEAIKRIYSVIENIHQYRLDAVNSVLDGSIAECYLGPIEPPITGKSMMLMAIDEFPDIEDGSRFVDTVESQAGYGPHTFNSMNPNIRKLNPSSRSHFVGKRGKKRRKK